MRYPGGLPRAETSRDIHGLIRAYISLRARSRDGLLNEV